LISNYLISDNSVNEQDVAFKKCQVDNTHSRLTVVMCFVNKVNKEKSAKCKPVLKPHANLPDSPADLTGIPK
jgi:hypothetical protein